MPIFNYNNNLIFEIWGYFGFDWVCNLKNHVGALNP